VEAGDFQAYGRKLLTRPQRCELCYPFRGVGIRAAKKMLNALINPLEK
jgi:hypothetical protein